MIEIVFPGETFDTLKADLLSSPLESCAICLTQEVSYRNDSRLLVREIRPAFAEAYAQRSESGAQLKPEFIAPFVKRARNSHQGLVFVHTHPYRNSPATFSRIDDEGEQVLSDFVRRRNVTGPHAAMLITPMECRARVLGAGHGITVKQIGKRLSIIAGSRPNVPEYSHGTYDRQVRAFGLHGQERLRSLRVGIVGLGGTGSIVLEELAHLGVENYLLIDPDVVDESNLNRLATAGSADIGAPKVDVASRLVHSVQPAARVSVNRGSVLDISVARLLVGVDFIFCCTDSHGSRAVLNQLAYQYVVPCIDMGVSLQTSGQTVTHMTGRVQMLSPGLGCLACGELLDGDAVRWDLMTDSERAADPYFLGPGEPAPSVMSLNGTMASLAVTMFLGATVGIPAQARGQIYNGITGSVRAVAISSDPNCIVCSTRGALGRGEVWPLPARQR